jgi:hypothetical protein
MIASSAEQVPILNKAEMQNKKPRLGLEEPRPSTHPLLGDAPRLQLIQERPMPRVLRFLVTFQVVLFF